MPEYLADVAEIGDTLPGVLQRVHKKATRTTVGCPNACGFCAVPIIEGEFRELDDWLDLPIICDNNLLAATRRHFDKVVDRLKKHKGVDFNQGLDAFRLSASHASRLAELDGIFRLAWDNVNHEPAVHRAYQHLRGAGIPPSRIRCYALFGYNDTPDDALYRIQTLVDWGVLPNPMRFTPINGTSRKYVGANWTEKELSKMHRWGSIGYLLDSIPFAEFDNRIRKRIKEQLSFDLAFG